MNSPKIPHIVIIGGGFGGIQTIKSFQKSGVQATITLVSNKSYFEYYPGLYKLVVEAVAAEVAVPLADIFPTGVYIKNASVTGIEPTAKIVQLDNGEQLSYDYVVVALGSVANYFGIAGLAEGSYSFKSVPEALRLKRHFCELLGSVQGLDPAVAKAKLAVAIIGAGPSGIELAGELVGYLKTIARDKGVDQTLISVHLIEGAPRILPTLSEKVSSVATKRLSGLGVTIHTNTALQSYEQSRIVFKEGELATETVVWTAGTKINELYSTIPGVTFTERKRVVVDDHLALPSDKNMFVIGDGAATEFAGLAQTAIHNGTYLGSHLARLIKGEGLKSYKPEAGSFVIPIGPKWALAAIRGRVFTGFLPAMLRGFIDFKYFWSILPFARVMKSGKSGQAYRATKRMCPVDSVVEQI